MFDFLHEIKAHLQALDEMLQTRFWQNTVIIIDVLFFMTSTFGEMLDDKAIFAALALLNLVTFWRSFFIIAFIAVCIVILDVWL